MRGTVGGTGGGNLTFDTGTFNVASLQLAVNTSGTIGASRDGVGETQPTGPVANTDSDGKTLHWLNGAIDVACSRSSLSPPLCCS